MFRRGLLILFSVLVTLGFFASSYAHDAIEQVTAPVTTFPGVVVVIKSANVRAGPGTDFPVISGASVGQRLTVLGCNADCSWYQLANDCWIAAFLVKPEQPAAPPIVPGGIVLPTRDARLPTVVVSIPITVTGGAIQTTRCPQTLAAVNTYAGPGTFFPVVEVVSAGECVAIVGRNTLGDWFQLSHGMWVLAAAVIYAEPIENLPVVDRIFTATPEPPPTPSGPNLSVEEQEYENFVRAQAQVYDTTWTTLANQFTLLTQNPLLIATEDWQSLTRSSLLFIRVANENVRTRVPTPRFTPTHAQMLSAADQFDFAVSLITEGLDTADVSKFVEAQSHITDGNNSVLRAISIIDQIKLEQPIAQMTALVTPSPLPSATCVPTVTVVSTIFMSNGLGLTREAWEAKMGLGVPDVLPSFQRYGELIVAFADNKVSYIERQWANPVSPEVALAEGMSYSPLDGVPSEVYNPIGRPETTIHLYMSPTLIAQFPADSFINGQPGNYTVQYSSYDGQVTRMIVALGNNP